MKTGAKVGLLSGGATLLVGGVTLLLTLENTPGRTAGVLCITLAFVIPAAFWIQAAFVAERAQVRTSVDSAVEKLQSYNRNLEETARRLGVRNDARFLPEGFIGLQKQSLVLEEDTQTGPERVRMAVLGHLPSHMRLTELSDERGRQLYDNWEPPHLIADYVRLVNRRSSALRRFLDTGGIVREIYDKAKLSQYVAKGSTFHDKIQDPPDEIIERLRTLIHFIAKPNYYISLVGDDQDRPGPHLLLKQGVGLVVDLRTAETQKHFTKSLDGLYTDSPVVMEGFEEKFSLAWRQIEKDQVRDFLENLVRKAQGKPTHQPEA